MPCGSQPPQGFWRLGLAFLWSCAEPARVAERRGNHGSQTGLPATLRAGHLGAGHRVGVAEAVLSHAFSFYSGCKGEEKE